MPLSFAIQGVGQPDPSDITDTINSAANKYGVSPAYLTQVAALESANNPKATSPTGAKGLFQFMDGTSQQYGLRNPYDPTQSADAAARLTSDNQSKLTSTLGRPPTTGELYLAHQQGAAGAGALLANPNQSAVAALAPVYGGSVARATKAITANGGSPDMTAGAFANKWTSNFDAQGDKSQSGSASPSADTNAQVPVTQPDKNAQDDAPAPAASGGASQTQTAKSKLNFAQNAGNAAYSAFTSPISAPSLMQLSSTPASGPQIPGLGPWPTS